MEKIRAPRGTADIYPPESARWQAFEARARALARRFGYGEIRTPMFESTELFVRGVGETTDIVEKEMYTFTDKGGRSLTLRPEWTAPVVRAMLEHNLLGARTAAAVLHRSDLPIRAPASRPLSRRRISSGWSASASRGLRPTSR